MPSKSKDKPIDRALVERLPKTDLHLHLDGSLRLSTLIELAKRRNVKLPAYSEKGLLTKVFKRHYRNLPDYLQGFAYTVAVMQHASDLRRIAYELAKDNQAEGVRYIEVRFAPQLHTTKGLSLREVLHAVNDGFAKAEREFNNRAAVKKGEEPPFKYGIIVCAMRYFEEVYSKDLGRFLQAHRSAPLDEVFGMASLELARTTAKIVAEDGLPVVGFDLAGAERGNPASSHRAAYGVAHDAFLGLTVHAGEDYGPESIFQALTDLHADRIGHGTHLFDRGSIHDRRIKDRKRYVDKLVQYVGDRRITLEVCLTSNLQTMPKLASLKQHPFGKMLRHRLSATICTDNRLVSRTTVTDEIMLAVEAFNLNMKQLVDITAYGFKRSFYPGAYLEKRKYVHDILEYFDRVVDEWRESR